MQQAAPPSTRPTGSGKSYSRRSSAPFRTSQRDLLAASSKAGEDVGAPASLIPRVGSTTANGATTHTKERRPELQESLDEEKEESRRESSMVFPIQATKHEQNDAMMAVVSLQQNIVGLTLASQREKTVNEHLKKQIEALAGELAKANELYEEEKTKNEKIAAMRKQQKGGGNGEYAGCLPDIHASAAAAAALQQQAQLEVTYQRKILSLENRYKDLMENNKRLLRKIEQLEKTEKDADSLIENLRQENVRLGAQVDSLSSTVASQTSLIIGLRTSLQKLNQDEHQMGALQKKLDRSQIDLEATRVREKILRDEHDRMKLIMSKEKETLMAKIMEFQQRLQRSDRAGDDLQALDERIKQLEFDKRIVVEELVTQRDHTAKAETRMHEQEQMTNRLLLEAEALQLDKKDMVFKITRLQDELEAKSSVESKLQVLQQREREVEQLMARTIELQAENDSAARTNSKLQNEISALKQLQLSHDETVQALQLARQKAATHEALALVNEEKQALETALQEVRAELENERAGWKDEKAGWGDERAVLVRRIHALEEEVVQNQDQVNELVSEMAVLRDRPPEQIIVETIVETVARPTTAETNERERIEADIERLRIEHGDLREAHEAMEKEYNRLITKKYKTEAFQSQVKLLQNENNELGSRLEDLLREQERDQAELRARTTEIVELQSRVLDPQAITMLRQTQESLEKTVSSLVEAEIASESTFTCLQCMRLYVSPMTLTPCGHTYCASCMDSMGNPSLPSSINCKECSSTQREETESVFPNQALADLTARYLFRQQTLSSLTTMCLSLRNSFASRSRS